jgi:hypothetical protein
MAMSFGQILRIVLLYHKQDLNLDFIDLESLSSNLNHLQILNEKKSNFIIFFHFLIDLLMDSSFFQARGRSHLLCH